MAYKTLRESRYQDLRQIGFAQFEARILSKIPRKTPYMKDLAVERAKEYARFQKTGKPEKEWETHILRRYHAKGWVMRGNKVRSASSVYAMLREKRDVMLPKYPKYQAPSKLREKRFRRVAASFDASLRNIKAIYGKPEMKWED